MPNNIPPIDLSGNDDTPGARTAASTPKQADSPSMDLPGSTEEPSTPPSPTGPPATPDRYRDSVIKREEEDAHERRSMRIALYLVVLLFAVFFLAIGLSFALDVGYGLLSAKKSIVGALTSKDTTGCLIPLKCITDNAQGTSSVQAKELASSVNLNTDWLSASSLIMIVAFILGVGLTLILTLLKFSFNHPTDKPTRNEAEQTAVEIASPLSQLIVNFVTFLKEKFSK
ncbi:hypothetical protein ACXWYY_002907 [Enterobacter hormaechei]